jgi:hypothetical protein
MKLLYINSWCHDKNKNALFNYKNIQYDIIDADQINTVDLSQYNAVYNPSEPMDVSKYPNTIFIFGPHFSVFPDTKINLIKYKNTVYTQPSDWARDVWRNWNNGDSCNQLKIETLPFGVETEKFNEIHPIHARNKVFIYCKMREMEDINFMIEFLKTKNINYKIFNYSQRYSEDEYIDYLHESKYGIWVGRHESQGFALEEALSCNVPLFVWDVNSMNQEVGQNYDNIPATSIPYWDEQCGEFFHKTDEIHDKFNLFLSKIETYHPRQFVLNHLSMQKCEEKLIHLINGISL